MELGGSGAVGGTGEEVQSRTGLSPETSAEVVIPIVGDLKWLRGWGVTNNLYNLE